MKLYNFINIHKDLQINSQNPNPPLFIHSSQEYLLFTTFLLYLDFTKQKKSIENIIENLPKKPQLAYLPEDMKIRNLVETYNEDKNNDSVHLWRGSLKQSPLGSRLPDLEPLFSKNSLKYKERKKEKIFTIHKKQVEKYTIDLINFANENKILVIPDKCKLIYDMYIKNLS